jgi:putative ABC transport system permease protein
MVFSENFRVAFRALRANKLRSILTTLGIIIGVAAVIAVVSIVQGLQFMITKQLQGVGATYVMVLPKQDGNQRPRDRRAPGAADLGRRPGDPRLRCRGCG